MFVIFHFYFHHQNYERELTEYLDQQEMKPEEIDLLKEDILNDVEADSYWGLDSILSHMMDNYTFDQKGIQSKVNRIEEIISKISPKLYEHFKDNGVMFIHFCFRWINCCLLREFKLPMALRLWDSFMSIEDGNGFTDFNVYCCCALLTTFESQLLEMDFSEMIQFLQHLPTADWNDNDIQSLVSQAYIYQDYEHNSMQTNKSD